MVYYIYVPAPQFTLPCHTPFPSCHYTRVEPPQVTVTVTHKSGETGTGYTYTGGKGGHAIFALIDRDLRPIIMKVLFSDLSCCLCLNRTRVFNLINYFSAVKRVTHRLFLFVFAQSFFCQLHNYESLSLSPASIFCRRIPVVLQL